MIYRKRGRVARWEHGTLVMIDEAGVAIEERGVFEVHPLVDHRALPFAPDDVDKVAAEITRLAKPERLVVTHGIAEHEANGVMWTEETRRVHVSIARNGFRALIDQADFDLVEITRIVEAMHRAAAERDPPARIRLAASVTAALLPSLAGVAPPNVMLWQTRGGYDGNGVPAEDVPVIAPPWPNVFRPSYRIRPVAMPLNLRLESEVEVVDRDLPEAIAVLAPVHGTSLRVLVAGRKSTYPATIRVVRIDAVSRDRAWYPYGAGAFGSEIML
jgi:hypothetical protein